VQRDGAPLSLPEIIRAAPERVLGREVAAAFGDTLPFLLKVLAAETPLSLQAHPDSEQAREGFARENAAGIPLGAPQRSYQDANAKPELLCALTEFEGLCGFRDTREALALFTTLDVPALDDVAAALGRGADGLREAFARILARTPEECARLVPEVARAARLKGAAPFQDSLSWAARLSELYPHDPGVIASLLLNHVRLRPGEAIYLPPRVMHAYLRGTGVEIMASSDNVLRGGCTHKHVDRAELLRVLDFRPTPPSVVSPSPRSGGEWVYETFSPEFQLSRFELRGTPVTPARRGPEIVLCVEGALWLEASGQRLDLPSGASAFVSASDPPYAVHGEGVLFRAAPRICDPRPSPRPEGDPGVHSADRRPDRPSRAVVAT
jgi:mannose-6-phosphate isomerase